MDTKGYLQKHGWKEGEALRKGGLRKPILVKHKRDFKGLGHDADQAVAWWEQVFDGQLKALNVSAAEGSSSTGAQTQGGLTFKKGNNTMVSGAANTNSPLYRMFVRGEGLAGTIGADGNINAEKGAVVKAADFKQPMKHTNSDNQLMIFDISSDDDSGGDSDSDNDNDSKKKMGKSKKDSKKSKNKKDKRDKRSKEKKENKDKKVKKDKETKNAKSEKLDKKAKKDKKDKNDKADKAEKREKKEKKRKSDANESSKKTKKQKK